MAIVKRKGESTGIVVLLCWCPTGQPFSFKPQSVLNPDDPSGSSEVYYAAVKQANWCVSIAIDAVFYCGVDLSLTYDENKELWFITRAIIERHPLNIGGAWL